MGVDVQGDVYPGVAKDLLQDFRILSALQPEGGEGVAQSVEGRFLRQFRHPGKGLEVSLEEVVAVHGTTRSGREDEVASLRVLLPSLLPPLGTTHPLLQVAAAVGLQRGDGLKQEVDGSALVFLCCP